MSESMIDLVRRVVSESRGVPLTAEEVAEMAGITRVQAGAILPAMRSRGEGLIRLGAGVYAWRPDRPDQDVPPTPGHPRVVAKHPSPQSADLAEAARLIDDEILRKVGLEVAGRSVAGDRIAFDEDGTAWLIVITIEARLL